MKLVRDNKIKRAVSLFAVVDIVFYKDEKRDLYRLKWIEDEKSRTLIESLHHVICLGRYAPEVIEGEIRFNSERCGNSR